MSWSRWNNMDAPVRAGSSVVNSGQQMFVDGLSAVARSDDVVTIYARGQDDRLIQCGWRRREGWSWWQPHQDGGVLGSAPSSGSRNGEHEVVAVRGTDGKLWTKEWTAAGGWSSWTPRGSSQRIRGAPTVICRNNDVINVYARGLDDRVLQIFWERGRDWRTDWQVHSDGGVVSSSLAAISLDDDHEALFARGTDRRLWWKEWRRGPGWTAWSQIGGGGLFQGAPSALSRNPDAMNVYVRGDDDALYQLSWTRTSGWAPAFARHADGGLISAPPAAARISNDSEFVFARGTDGRLWSKWWHREGVLTMPIHFIYVDRPENFSFTTEELVAATGLVFGGALVSVVASVQQLSDSTLLDINVGACVSWGIFTTLSTTQERLFRNRVGAGADDICVYLVRSASGFAGCAVHTTRPAAVVTRLASAWVAAHEIGHVLGRGHEGDSTDKLMFPMDSFTTLPPNLGSDQVDAGSHIRRR